MSIASKTSETLNDLIKINNDRIEGYEKAIKELDTEDTDLQSLFREFCSQSEGLKRELEQNVMELGEETADGSTASGSIYRAWMDVKAAFSGDTRKAVLQSCEFGEDAAQKAYRMAEEEPDIAPNTKILISKQKLDLKSSHDRVKTLRDSME
ncbi:ferritin-like domain-containing protein [Albibacterium profundi]|uniref:PA2169 family four-helix-bundle protein n=1 Tax=Albibacterium profundi TaxID=3134906 RepID=A0ABV5CG11_9SPHI